MVIFQSVFRLLFFVLGIASQSGPLEREPRIQVGILIIELWLIRDEQ